jgi:nucleoside-diphosphate-sugar epimerase
MLGLPERINTTRELDEILSRPSGSLVELVKRLEGDILILGAAGKIGPSLARMARRAVDAAGVSKQVFAVDLSPPPAPVGEGVATLCCDLLDLSAVQKLPRAANVIFMAGRKFGSAGGESLTWAINVMVPYHVARTFLGSRVVVFSTGCVYPLADVRTGGTTEDCPPNPVGEYAMSCLGRERMFDHFSHTAGLKVVQFRLNYAVELRYGVLADVAAKVWAGLPVDVTTGHANVIWQGDVCNRALLCLGLAASPPRVLNITGPETLSIRHVALTFARLLGKEVEFTGQENGLAYLSDAAQANALFGHPSVPVARIIEWIAHWITIGGESLGKPTHFETQNGKY